MKENILYAYHLNIENIKEYNEYSVFEFNEKRLDRDDDDDERYEFEFDDDFDIDDYFNSRGLKLKR